MFGHGVYRMDVSDRISNGSSWQLGVFAAHFLQKREELAERTEDATHLLWLTGEVNNNLDVGVVDHVAEKLERSAEMLSEVAARGKKVVLAYPKGNEAEVARILGEKKIGLDMANIELRPVTNTDDLMVALTFDNGNALPGAAGPETPVTDNTPSQWRPRMVWFACALTLIVSGFLGWNIFGEILRWRAMAADGAYDKLLRDLEATKTGSCTTCWAATAIYPLVAGLGQPGKEDMKLTVSEVRAPNGRSCSSVRFATTPPEERSVQIEADDRFAASLSDGLCGLVYRLRNAGSAPFHGWLSVRIGSGKLARTSNRGGTKHARIAPGEDVSVSVSIPDWLGSDVIYNIHAIADGKASDDLTRWMAEASSRGVATLGLGERAMTHEVILTKK